MKLIKAFNKYLKSLSKLKRIIILTEIILIVPGLFIQLYYASTEFIDNTFEKKEISEPLTNKNSYLSKKEYNEKVEEDKKTLLNEILLGEGHPIYAESIKNIFSYATDTSRFHYTSVNFLPKKRHNKYNNHTVLSIEGFEYSDVTDHITDIQIYPTNINYHMEEREALELANKYLPTNIIDNYYKYPTTEICVSDNPSEKTRILIKYEFNDDIYKETNTLNYKGNIYILLEKENNKVTMIRLFNSLPKWMMMCDWHKYEIN